MRGREEFALWVNQCAPVLYFCWEISTSAQITKSPFLASELINGKLEARREIDRKVNFEGFKKRRWSRMRLKARFQEWMISLLERRYSGI